MNQGEPIVWMSWKLVTLSEAKISVRAHVTRYASNVFSGMRGYKRKGGVALMRLDDHVPRLLESAEIHRMADDLRWSADEIRAAIIDTILCNKDTVKSPYVNINIFRGEGGFKIDPSRCSVEMAIDILDWQGRYLPDHCRAKVSSWSLVAPNTMPMMAKSGGNYPSSALVKMEADDCGADEALRLTTEGYVSDASGGNIFLVYQGELWTPPTGDCGLPGITRRSVITLAKDLDIKVIRTEHIPREMLYACSEAFICGSAAEITSLGQIDHRKFKAPGEVTRAIADKYYGIAEGRLPDKYGWMTEVKF